MRVKAFIIVSILALILGSCTQRNISTVHIVKEGDYTIELKKFTILKKEYDYNIVNYKDIDYISVNDAYEILSIIDKQTNKYNLDSGNINNVFDWENNRINIELTKVISPARAIFSGKQNNFKISGIEDFKNYRIETTLLDDFNICYISVNNTIYLPLMLLNFSVFDNEFMLYPFPDNKNLVLDEIYAFSDEYIDWVNSNCEKVLIDSPSLREFSAIYLYEFINRNYPYISIRQNNLLSLDLDSINSYDDYKRYVLSCLDSLDDDHTVSKELMAPEFKDLLSSNDYNIIIRFNEYMKAIEANPSFVSSEYKIIDDNIGYIRIHTFYDDNDIFYRLPYIFKELQNTDGLIIDLRFNQGGALTNAFQLLDPIVEKNNTIDVYYNQMFSGKLTDIKKFKLTKVGNLFYKKPIVLLTNKFSYSSSNTFAGIFKDNELGTIIGEKTLGGGSTRITNVLPDGISFSYSNPNVVFCDSNGDFFETGIEPDILVEENLENYNDKILEKAIDYLINVK